MASSGSSADRSSPTASPPADVGRALSAVATQFDLVTLNCADPRALARFWCGALDLHVTEDEDDGRWLVLSDADANRRLGLQGTDDEERPLVRAVVVTRVHLDLRCTVEEFDGELTRLQMLGARLVGPVRTEPYGRIANLADPADHPFDLCAYD